MIVLSPKRDQAATLNKSIATQQPELQPAEAQLATYEKAKAGFKPTSALVARLGKAVPADDDVRSLLVQLDAAAGKSGVDFRTIEVGSGAGAPAPAATPSTDKQTGGQTPAPPTVPGATPVGTAGFSQMPFQFSFKGSFFNLGDFFERLDRFVAVNQQRLDVTGRLMVLNTITLAPDTAGFPNIRASIGATTYMLPATQGLTAGPTPQGPATSTTAAPGAAASPTPGAPSSPTTTTAAIGATR